MSRSQPSNATSEPVPATTPPPALQAAPAAMKRSMPQALSIMLGLLGAALFGWLFYNLTWFILLLYLSLVIGTIVDAPVSWLEGKGVRRGISTVVIMFGLVGVIGTGLYFLLNWAAGQATALAADFHTARLQFQNYLNHLADRFPGFADQLRNVDLAQRAASAVPQLSVIWQKALSGFELVTYAVVCFFIVMYMVIDGPDHLRAIRQLVPKSARLELTALFEEMAGTHRRWFVSHALNITSATTLNSIGLLILGVPGFFILGFIAGLGELIPNIGPLLGALPTLALVLLTKPHIFPYTVLMFAIAQTIQGYTISPFVLKMGVRLPVLAMIISVLVMATLFGVLGVVVAIPLTADLVVLWNYLNHLLESPNGGTDEVNAAPAPVRAAPASVSPVPGAASRNPRELGQGGGGESSAGSDPGESEAIRPPEDGGV